MKTDLGRVRGLLTEAITMLCKSSLVYRTEFSIEGLLGITLDNNEVFLININEKVQELKLNTVKVCEERASDVNNSPHPNSPAKRKRLRAASHSPSDLSELDPYQEDTDNSCDPPVLTRTTPPLTFNDTNTIKREPACEGGPIQSVDFGDIVANYESEDLETSYNETLVKDEHINTSNVDEADGEEDDIVIVSEDRAGAVAPTAADLPATTQQYDYYNEQQQFPHTQQSYLSEFNPQQNAGTSYEQWPGVEQLNTIKQTQLKLSQKQRSTPNKGSPKTPARTVQQVSYF